MFLEALLSAALEAGLGLLGQVVLSALRPAPAAPK
jgi:hypothetical protein